MNSTPKQKLHHRIARTAKHWFIPHEGNDHRPHALRPKALRAYAYVLIAAKVASVIFLFAAFPSTAEFAEFTSSTILTLTNTSRTQGGLSTLKENALLDLAAQRKAKDMIARNYFAHTTPDGKRFWTWIDATGYNYTLAGENLAIDFTTPEAAHAALMASPTHKANIMNSRYKDVGIAVVTGNMGGSETTVLVELFGTPVAQKTAVAKVTTLTTRPKPVVTKPATPTTKPKVQAAETPPPTGMLAQQSLDTFTLAPKAVVDVWAEFQNTGVQTWKTGSLSLVTAEPLKHTSPFVEQDWDSATTVGLLEQDVATNGVARFEWRLVAPTTTGATAEHFALVDSTGAQLAKTELTFNVTVQTPATVATTQPTPTQTDVGNPAPSLVPETTASTTPTTVKTNDFLSRLLMLSNQFYLGFIFFLILKSDTTHFYYFIRVAS